jgi:PilZ domain
LSLAGAILTFDGAPPLSEDRAVRIEIEEFGVAHDETNRSAKPVPASNGPGSTMVLNKWLTDRYPELAAHRRDQSRRHPRIEVDLPGRVQSLGTIGMADRTRNISLNGAMLSLASDADASLGSHRRLEFQAICAIDALVVRRFAAGTAVHFTGMEEGPGSN